MTKEEAMKAMAKFLSAPNGPRIAVLESDGWDTHARQGVATGSLANKFSVLDKGISVLQQGLGDAWANTVVMVVTEFGRTAKANGTGGTDHGTATAAMLVGGAEMATTPVGLGGFAAARALSTRNDDPEAASRPWDRDRDGFVLGDGAGVFMLEEYESAKARGAKIYAEVLGFGMSGDAYHMTLPPEDGRGAAAAMSNAIRDAGVATDRVNYINAHGTSTNAGDVAESRAVESVLGNDAAQVAVSSTKSMIGHLLGAAGAVEAIFSILAVRDQVAPPTINLDNVDEGCTLNYVPNTAQERAIDCVVSNSFGFGGTNGSLLFANPD